jgi:hypothetical protein
MKEIIIGVEKYINLTNIIILINSILLFVATGRHPSNFYTNLRWIVTISISYLIYNLLKESKKKILIPIYVIIGAIFNPIFPIYMSRSVWFWFDILVGIGFLMTIYFNTDEKS